MLAAIALASTAPFSKPWGELAAVQRREGLAAADSVLVQALNIACLNAAQPGPAVTAPPRATGDMRRAQLALHPDKWTAAPPLVGRASAVGNAAAAFVSQMTK